MNGTIISGETNSEININLIEGNKGLTRFDADVTIINDVFMPYFESLSRLDYPDDFDSTEIYRAVWVKKDKTSKDYDILNHYERWAVNTSNNRSIMIAFSEESILSILITWDLLSLCFILIRTGCCWPLVSVQVITSIEMFISLIMYSSLLTLFIILSLLY